VKVVSSVQMGEIDRLATEEYAIPGLLLMENAGLQVVDAAFTLLTPAGSRAVILCGTGNNGGDGLVVARHLSNSGCQVSCYLLGDPDKLRGDALTNYIILTRMGLSPTTIKTEADLESVALALLGSHLVVDALYGTGFSGTLTGLSQEVVALINQANAPVLAIDIPSGLDANSGQVNGLAVQADWTVTMGLPKLGLLEPKARSYVGKLTVADISLPLELLNSSYYQTNLITQDHILPYFPPRANDSHKGDYGHVMVIGGCPDMTGAVVMASQAAMKVGAGLVTAVLPASARVIAASQLPPAMTIALPDTEEGQLAIASLEPLLAALAKMTVGVIGPGMSRYEQGEVLVAEVIRRTPVPLVIDADALNMLAGNLEVLKAAGAPLILTPHPGEMARLTGRPVSEIQSHRLEIACNFAREYGVVLVLKGSHTLIATPDGEAYINCNGNPGMACGGSGDVLSGMIAGLVAQGLPVAAAAWTGVHMHGSAGDLSAQEYGERSMTALEIIEAIPQVFKQWGV